MPVVTWLRRQWHLAVLAGWSAIWWVILAPHGGIAWTFFVQGTDILFTSHGIPGSHRPGLHLYADYPQLQIGPAAYAVAEVLRQIGPDYGLVAAEIAMTAMGLLVIVMIQQIAFAARPELPSTLGPVTRPGRVRLYLLVAGAFFMIAWEELAVAFGHLDDCLAIVGAVAAIWAWVALRAPAGVRAASFQAASFRATPFQAALAGTAIGLAAAAKPWAFVFLPVIALPLGARAVAWPVRVRAVAVAAACVAVVTLAAWLPFFVADPATTNALHYQIENMPNSALRALGVSTAMTPSWDRAAQILVGCGLGLVAIVRRRWAGLILLGAGARIALDPGVHKYYTPEVMAGVLLWELVGMSRPLPVWTVTAFTALNLAPYVTSDTAVQGAIRLAVVLAFTVTVLVAPAHRHRQQDSAPGGDHPDRGLAEDGRSVGARRGADR